MAVLYCVANQLGCAYPRIRDRRPTLGYYLTSGPNLNVLALWTDLDIGMFLPDFAELRLQKLSANLSTLEMSDFQGRSFENITHLNITRIGNVWDTHWQPG